MSVNTAKLDEYVSKADATLADYASVTQYGEFSFESWKDIAELVVRRESVRILFHVREYKLWTVLYSCHLSC